jgi:uncharacterized protein (TIGR02246 family)
MKNIFLGITIAIFLMCGNTFAQSQPTDDEQAIFAVMTNVGKAWDALDAKKFGEFMTEDCTHVDPNGLHTGRNAIVKHIQWVIDNLLPKDNSKMEVSDFSLRFVNSETALFGFLGVQGGQSMRQSYVLIKTKNEWKITSFQLTKIEQEKNSSK